MIRESEITLEAGDELINHLFFAVAAALLGAAIGVAIGAWMMSHWAAALTG